MTLKPPVPTPFILANDIQRATKLRSSGFIRRMRECIYCRVGCGTHWAKSRPGFALFRCVACKRAFEDVEPQPFRVPVDAPLAERLA